MIVRQYLHAMTDEEAFVELMGRKVPPRPERFAEIRAENPGRQPATR